MTLRCDALTLRQGDFTLTADFDIPAGLTAVLGASGSGKSTLLNAVAGFLQPAQGRIMWDGAAMTEPPGKRPVSILFQDHNLFPHLTVAQNVGLGLRGSLRFSAADQGLIDTVLADVGLGGFGTRRPADLSGGQQSRCALARAHLSGHPIALLDEPFAALGPGLRAELLQLTKARFAGRHVVMVTHDPQDAQHADNLIVVADGVAHPPEPAHEALANPSDALRDYLGH